MGKRMFKVGDKVKYVGNDLWLGIKPGNIGTVEKVSKDNRGYLWLTVSFGNRYDSVLYSYPEDFELITSAMSEEEQLENLFLWDKLSE
jgi:hypothetical protein